MTFTLPNPTSPASSDPLTSLPIRQNFQAIASAINAFDGGGVTSGTIPDSALITSPTTRWNESFFSYVVSGLTISTSASLVGSFTSGTAYIGGVRVVSLGTTKTFTASKDTYVDMDSTGAFFYTEVSNNTTSPSLSAGRIRLAIVITSGSAITTINQGDPGATAPVVSSTNIAVCDTNGNMIYNTTPTPSLIGIRKVYVDQTAITAAVDVTGSSVPVIIPTGRKVKLSWEAALSANVASAIGNMNIKEGSTILKPGQYLSQNAGNAFNFNGSHELLPTSGSHTYKLNFQGVSGTWAIIGSFSPILLRAELV